jgi:hypothetical protein
VEHRRGDPSVITLLREDGSGEAYSVPRGEDRDFYFQLPAELWTTCKLQQLSAAGLAMLMAVLSWRKPGDPVWWSTETFPSQYGLSSATRARGTRELVEAGLLVVERKLVPPSAGRSFSVDRVRSIYRVAGEALAATPQATTPGDLAIHETAP